MTSDMLIAFGGVFLLGLVGAGIAWFAYSLPPEKPKEKN